MPNFAEGVVESIKQIRLTMPEIRKPELPEPIFVSEKQVHDCILHAIRDQRANVFWQAVEAMSDDIADTMPAAFVPFTTRSPSGYPKNTEGWGGRWPVGMLGVSNREAEQVFLFAKSFPEWDNDYPPIVARMLLKQHNGPVTQSG